ncbi:MAG: type II toxin-antitoxin system PemK/MazF family toxin [Candidatus Micrarchaeota archaeon]
MAAFPSRGEVWLAGMPDGFGREQKGDRPVVVMATAERFGVVCAVPLTSSPLASGFPNALKIAKTKENGLSVDSVALAFQITAFSELRFLRKMGELSEVDFKAVKAEAKIYLGL